GSGMNVKSGKRINLPTTSAPNSPTPLAMYRRIPAALHGCTNTRHSIDLLRHGAGKHAHVPRYDLPDDQSSYGRSANPLLHRTKALEGAPINVEEVALRIMSVSNLRMSSYHALNLLANAANLLA